MTDQEKIQSLIIDCDNLRIDREYLKGLTEKQSARIQELEKEHELVLKTIVKTLDSVGLWPISKSDNLAAKAMRGIKGVISDSLIRPDSLAKRFAFLEDVYPLCEKYKDIQL